jgi:hypothetical protein
VFIVYRYFQSIVEFGVCMSLLTFPIGVEEVSVVKSIGEYIIKKVPERWLNGEDDKGSKEREEEEKSVDHILFRWR